MQEKAIKALYGIISKTLYGIIFVIGAQAIGSIVFYVAVISSLAC